MRPLKRNGWTVLVSDEQAAWIEKAESYAERFRGVEIPDARPVVQVKAEGEPEKITTLYPLRKINGPKPYIYDSRAYFLAGIACPLTREDFISLGNLVVEDEVAS